MLKRMDVTSLRDSLSDALSRAGYGGERIIVSRNGKPIAALVPVRDVDELESRHSKGSGGQPREQMP